MKKAGRYCFAGGDWSNVVTNVDNYNNIPPRRAYDRGIIPSKQVFNLGLSGRSSDCFFIAAKSNYVDGWG